MLCDKLIVKAWYLQGLQFLFFFFVLEACRGCELCELNFFLAIAIAVAHAVFCFLLNICFKEGLYRGADRACNLCFQL